MLGREAMPAGGAALGVDFEHAHKADLSNEKQRGYRTVLYSKNGGGGFRCIRLLFLFRQSESFPEMFSLMNWTEGVGKKNEPTCLTTKNSENKSCGEQVLR